MLRNEKGQFVKEPESLDSEIQEIENRLMELKKEKAEKEEAEKKAAAIARKEEANIVNEAIDKYEEAKIVCNEKIKAAYDEYQKKVNEAEKELRVLETDADEKLNKFLETHDSFHYSYKSKDGKVERNYDYRNKAYNSFDDYAKFLDALHFLGWGF